MLSKQHTYRPTRLLELTSRETFRLIRSAACPSPTEYVALSYCWGKSPPETQLRLLRTTEAYLSSEQLIESLPKTFRDAIEVTRQFGLRYLWIDRLCIFQDSAEDWRNEASTMRHVYGNAHFAIAALSGKDADGGLFFSRDPQRVTPPTVHAKPGTEERFQLLSKEVMLSRDFLLTFLSDEPLMRRSWVVQELLLPVRTIYIGSRWNFWFCRSGRAAEPFPTYFSLTPQEKGLLLAWNSLLGTARWAYVDPIESILSDWSMAIRYYAARELSVPSDKLVAISAIAKDVQAALHRAQPGTHNFLAGIWEEDILIGGLLWVVDAPAKRAMVYRAPSWSWACVDGLLPISTITWVRPSYHNTYSRLISTSIQYLTDDCFGEVTGGSLTLAVPLAVIFVTPNLRSPQPHREHIEGVSNIIAHSDPNADRSDSRVSHDLIHHTYRAFVIFDTLEDIVPVAYLVWVRAIRYNDCYHVGDGLVLVRADGTSYRRIGYMRMFFHSSSNLVNFANALPERVIEVI